MKEWMTVFPELNTVICKQKNFLGATTAWGIEFFYDLLFRCSCNVMQFQRL